mgnify:CR=1 FL=1
MQLKDVNGNNLTTSGGTVLLTTTLGTLSAVTDNGDGTYTATLTSATTAGTATISGTLAGTAITDTATVAFTTNTAPVFIGTNATDGGGNPSYSFNYVEGATDTTTLGTVSATDADGNPLTFSITAGDPGGGTPWFEIDPTTGGITLTAAGVLAAGNDYETLPNLHTLTVTVTDGTNPVAIEVKLTEADVIEAPLKITHDWMTIDREFPTRYVATFRISLENDGATALTSVTLVNDLVAYLGAANFIGLVAAPTKVSGPAGITLNAGFNGSTDTALLPAGTTFAPYDKIVVDVTFRLSTASGFPVNPNVATGNAAPLASSVSASDNIGLTDNDNDGAVDSLESPTADRDGDGIADADDYDPTGYFYCQEDGRILTGGTISVTDASGSSANVVIDFDGTNGFYQWYATAAGRYTMQVTYPARGIPSTTRLVSTNPLDVTSLLPDDPAFIGSTETGSTGKLADFSLAANPTFYTVFDIEAGDPNVMANNIPLENCATGMNVESLDLVASEGGDPGALGFTLSSQPTANVTLTFAGDGQCTVSPTTITFTPDNWNVAQDITILATPDDVDEGNHSCTPTVTVTSADPVMDGFPLTLPAISIYEGRLIASIEDELKQRLEQDLRATVRDTSREISGFASDAGDRLRAGEVADTQCRGPGQLDPNGDALYRNGSAVLNLQTNEDYYDCIRDERVIVETAGRIRTSETGETTLRFSGSYLRERREGDDKIRGRFVSAYLNLPDIGGSSDRISGVGLSFGVYGATRLNEDLVGEHYLALGLGRHAFSLTFARDTPIVAEGTYGYAAAYAGAALSGEIDVGGMPVGLRGGVDLAFAMPTRANVEATDSTITETGSVALDNQVLVRAFTEADFTSTSGDKSRSLSFTPGVFCDGGTGTVLTEACGVRAGFEILVANGDGSRETGVELDGEASNGATSAGLRVRHIRYFDDRNGRSELGVSGAVRAAPSLDYSLRWDF